MKKAQDTFSRTKKIFAACLLVIVSLSISTFFMPTHAEAFSLVYTCQHGPLLDSNTTEHECDFTDFLGQINYIVTDAFILAIPIATIVFTIAGVKLLTSQGNPSKMNDAKKMLTTTAVGFVFICAAWLIVYFIVTNLGCTACSQFLGGGTNTAVTSG